MFDEVSQEEARLLGLVARLERKVEALSDCLRYLYDTVDEDSQTTIEDLFEDEGLPL